ncbi:PadR family transcriptional regulator [Lactococcus protaetiae]|uniref:Helix-turn-helix transcriptional regulator n=1 Tax=Lactococcus protaetiae TaxID=2592653 RepID=A0A514Z9A3_9LACT|nr:PadR family transcriptional regulator [Lactococcus protaetiae]MCL2113438.1 PadR family transcriptional regulator [Streptococcaceae bacterium]QDK71171.1 helix-turn-helix transcriptional regulator [Lactococcus protaetiae]
MEIQIPSLLLDGTVLALLNQEDLYGYIITKNVQERLPISESTMYPVLRRLKKNELLETYDVPFEGRMRRYYRITSDGKDELKKITEDWKNFRQIIDEMLGETDE